MNTYQRLFGTGPRGLAISLLLLGGTVGLVRAVGPRPMHDSRAVGASALAIGVVLTVLLVVWSVRSLPVEDRGTRLTVGGAFRWFRHPLYAAFLLFFDFGLALFLDDWHYVAWAALQHPVWHLNVRGEEALMRDAFPADYPAYCAKTGRFFPRLRSRGPASTP